MPYHSTYTLGCLLATVFVTVLIAMVGKGGPVENKRFTHCFSNITLTNGYDSIKLVEYSSCQEAMASVGRYLYIKSASSSKDLDSCLGGSQLFYCATVMEVKDSLAPFIDIGDGSKRYAIETVFCAYMPE